MNTQRLVNWLIVLLLVVMLVAACGALEVITIRRTEARAEFDWAAEAAGEPTPIGWEEVDAWRRSRK